MPRSWNWNQFQFKIINDNPFVFISFHFFSVYFFVLNWMWFSMVRRDLIRYQLFDRNVMFVKEEWPVKFHFIDKKKLREKNIENAFGNDIIMHYHHDWMKKKCLRCVAFQKALDNSCIPFICWSFRLEIKSLQFESRKVTFDNPFIDSLGKSMNREKRSEQQQQQHQYKIYAEIEQNNAPKEP